MTRVARLIAIPVILAAGHAAWAGEADPFQAAASYELGQSRKPLAAVEKEVSAALGHPARQKAVERKLLALLASPKATLHSKWFACRQLALVGSAESVPVLAAHLGEEDKRLGFMARFALEQIPVEAAGAALRDALGQVEGQVLIGIINSLGMRRDEKAVPALTRLLAGAEANVAAAAAGALGRIGGAESCRALLAARKSGPPPARAAAEDALLVCASRLLDAGQGAEAKTLFAELHEHGQAPHVRLGAFAGLVKAEGGEAVPRVLAALESQTPGLRNLALRLAEALPGAQATQALAAHLREAPPNLAVALLDVLAARGDRAAAPAVFALAKDAEGEVRLAALRALGRLGDATAVPFLLTVATEGQDAERQAAHRALVQLPGEDVDRTLLAARKGAVVPYQVEIIRVLAARGSRRATPVLLQGARAAEADVRTASLRALQTLADVQMLPHLVDLLRGAEAGAERSAAEKTILTVLRRAEDKAKAATPVLDALEAKDLAPAPCCALLRIAGAIGGRRALDAVRARLKAAEPTVRDTAVRVLAGWDSPEPMADLLAIARSAESKTHRVLALRGVLRMAALPHKRPPEESVGLYAEAMSLATEPQEKKTILGELAKLRHPKALEMALGCLGQPAVAAEAAAAVVAISKSLLSSHNEQAVAALQKVARAFQGKEAGRLAEDALAMAKLGANVAPDGRATSPDGLEKDGAARGDQAAIDGNADTYWDEVDGKKLYRLVVTFPEPRRVAAISILGYGHHNYAPKDFQILANGKVVRTVENAQYANNFLVVTFPATDAKAIELKITGYYSRSPAIRELGIYQPPGK